jgi:MSHA pilin protein MshD
MCTDPKRLRQHGLTLIELILFIVIVSVGIVGILSVMNITIRNSADPMLRKQALSIAESLLEEIQLQPFTYCDPDDPAATTAINSAACATPQVLGPTPAAETRYNGFDNVGDYHGFNMNGIARVEDGGAIGGLTGYNATVAITPEAQGGVVAGDCWRIDVTTTMPGGETVTLTGYRFRYAPRAVP